MAPSQSLPGGSLGRVDAGSRSAPSTGRLPSRFQYGSPSPGTRPPGGGHDHDHHGGNWHHQGYVYFGGWGLGYGFAPYYGGFGLDDFYSNGYNHLPYRSSESQEWPDGRQGNVQLRIEPRDVQIFVDGVLSGRDGRATLNLPTGRWRLEFVKPGYRPETVDVEVTQGVSIRVERKLLRLSGEDASAGRDSVLPETGELHVDVRPDDAIVYLDGRALGLASDIRTSDAFRRLLAGRHQLEVRHPGYVSLRQEVIVSPVQPAEVRGELVPEKP